MLLLRFCIQKQGERKTRRYVEAFQPVRNNKNYQFMHKMQKALEYILSIAEGILAQTAPPDTLRKYFLLKRNILPAPLAEQHENTQLKTSTSRSRALSHQKAKEDNVKHPKSSLKVLSHLAQALEIAVKYPNILKNIQLSINCTAEAAIVKSITASLTQLQYMISHSSTKYRSHEGQTCAPMVKLCDAYTETMKEAQKPDCALTGVREDNKWLMQTVETLVGECEALRRVVGRRE